MEWGKECGERGNKHCGFKEKMTLDLYKYYCHEKDSVFFSKSAYNFVCCF